MAAKNTPIAITLKMNKSWSVQVLGQIKANTTNPTFKRP